MPTIYYTSTMSSDTETNKYFHTPIGTLPTPAVLPRATIGGVSALKIALGTETPTVNFAGNGGGTAFADMQAAVGSYANGAVAFCYAANSTQHGRYVKSGGAWVKTGNLAPLMEYDDNHMKVVNDLNLLCQTAFDTGHPAAVDDGPGPFVDKVAFPNVGDMTGHIMRPTMRFVDFKFPSDYHLGWHLQGQLAGVPSLGTGNAGAGAFPLVNAMNHKSILSDAGAGNGGIYADNTVNYIADTGWFAPDIIMSPSDAFWTMMLGNENKDGHEGAAYAQAVQYIGTSAKRLVGPDLQKLNAYLCGFRWNPTPGVPGMNTARPRVSPNFEPTGTIYISKIEFISP